MANEQMYNFLSSQLRLLKQHDVVNDTEYKSISNKIKNMYFE